MSGTVTDVGGGPIGDARITADPNGMPDLRPRRARRTDRRRRQLRDDAGRRRVPLEARTTTTRARASTSRSRAQPLTSGLPADARRGDPRPGDRARHRQAVPGALVRAEGGDRGAAATTARRRSPTTTATSRCAASARARSSSRRSAAATRRRQPTIVAVGIGEQVDGVRVLVDRAYSISGRVVRKGKPDKGSPASRSARSRSRRRAFGLALEPSAQDGSFEIVGAQAGELHAVRGRRRHRSRDRQERRDRRQGRRGRASSRCRRA